MKTQAPGNTLAERHDNWQPMADAVNEVVYRNSPKFRPTTDEPLMHAIRSSTHGVNNANRTSVTDANKAEFDLTSLISNFDRCTPEEIELRYTTSIDETIKRNHAEILREEMNKPKSWRK